VSRAQRRDASRRDFATRARVRVCGCPSPAEKPIRLTPSSSAGVTAHGLKVEVGSPTSSAIVRPNPVRKDGYQDGYNKIGSS